MLKSPNGWHLDYDGGGSRQWLNDESRIDPVLQEALLSEDPRPRRVASGDGLMLIVRGVNLNLGAAPEDMVSLRLWVDAHRLVSLRHRRLGVAEEFHEDFRSGQGPRGVGELLVRLIASVLDRIAAVTDNLDDQVGDLQDRVLTAQSYELRHKLGTVRRRAIALRRFIAPQRDVLARLQNERVDWFADMDRVQLRESADRLTRMIEELDAARDRAAVTQEELASRLAELSNKRLYVLSVVAAIFLPLGFITGILGVNLGGIPGTDDPWAFTILCVCVTLSTLVLVLLFRRARWL